MEEVEVLEIDEKPKKKKKLKKWIKILITLVMFLIFIVIAIIIIFNYLLEPVSTRSEVIEFNVENGSSVYSVGKKLEKEKIIKNYYAYKIYVKLKNINGYKAGVYKLDKSYSTKDIVEILSGDYYKKEDIKITFKEGKTIRGVAKEISKKTDISESEVYSLLEDDTYIDSLIDKYWFLTDDIKNENIYYPLEGYLFPETYSFRKNADIKEIIETMLDQTNIIFSKYKSQIDSSSYNINELVIMASIIEKEGRLDEDRKNISSVFYNRLKSGMSLGSDVTTYYAVKVEVGERDLTSKELNTYNPYNTRGPNMNGKLPVGAISNFGEKSFEAAINPNNTNYYYFVADKSGKTHFTKTYEEHQKIIKELKAANNWIEW